MFAEPHDLHHELPEYAERIHLLKTRDHHFRRLFEEYDEVVKELHRIEEQIETPSDAYVEQLKLKRLHLKDQLYDMLRHAD